MQLESRSKLAEVEGRLEISLRELAERESAISSARKEVRIVPQQRPKCSFFLATHCCGLLFKFRLFRSQITDLKAAVEESQGYMVERDRCREEARLSSVELSRCEERSRYSIAHVPHHQKAFDFNGINHAWA